jgi:phage host-nuclease inhibitor protein Gam
MQTNLKEHVVDIATRLQEYCQQNSNNQKNKGKVSKESNFDGTCLGPESSTLSEGVAENPPTVSSIF